MLCLQGMTLLVSNSCSVKQCGISWVSKVAFLYNPSQLFFFKVDIGIQQINYEENYMVIEVPIK